MNNLKPSGLKLWLYFNKNQEKYLFELSREDALSWGIKKDSYYAAIEDLIDKGYLRRFSEHSNHFYFYESLQEGFSDTFSEKTESQSNNQTIASEKPYRNNTNNTNILQNNTNQLNEYSNNISFGKRGNLSVMTGVSANMSKYDQYSSLEHMPPEIQVQCLKDLGF